MSMAKKQSPWRSPWIIGWVIILITFFVFSGTRIYFAVVTNPGLVVDDFYERGRDYEDNRLKRQARDPKWQMDLHMPDSIVVAEPATFNFSIKDVAGQVVTPDKVTFYAYRLSDKAKDFSAPMQETAPGEYTVDVSFSLKGAWDLLVGAASGDDEYYVSAYISAGVK